MTMAVCIKCGALKYTAFLPCEHCNQRPTGSDVGKALVLTDHHYTEDALHKISDMIKSGYDVFELMPEMQVAADDYQRMHERMADPEYRREFIAQLSMVQRNQMVD